MRVTALRANHRKAPARVVQQQGKTPGGLLDRAVKLSGGRPDATNYYFAMEWLDA